MSIDDLFREYVVWTNEPGGRVVRRFQRDNVKYVVVEFDNSPGIEYIYLANTRT